MSIQYHRQTDVSIFRNGRIRRRDFLRGISAAALAAGTLSWTDAIAASTDELRKKGMSCILLWMQGGPSQFETFSPKPGHKNGGETKAISTATSGIQIADNFPHVAKVMNELAIIRSMTSREGNHSRASFLLHHGYIPTASVKFPTMGSMVQHEIGDPTCELPGFVRIGNRSRNGGNGGFFGVDFDPFVLKDPTRPPENTKPTTDVERFQRRRALLESLESDFGRVEGPDIVSNHKKLLQKTSKMMLSKDMKAFDLEQEPVAMREAYGNSQFGKGCLLARRLVESGVTFVEVNTGSWDTHKDNFAACRKLTGETDQPMAQLITDLKQRGMLDKTLIVWMGEFGRTPKINGRGGRDHFPKAFNVALAGGGIIGGQVVGKTNAAGTEIIEHPIEVPDLFRTIYTALGIDSDKGNDSNIGRPIKIVDGGKVIQELLG